MKRTAKWMKHLTMAELKHLRSVQALSLRGIAANMREADPAFPCYECRHIAFKLREAGAMRDTSCEAKVKKLEGILIGEECDSAYWQAKAEAAEAKLKAVKELKPRTLYGDDFVRWRDLQTALEQPK